MLDSNTFLGSIRMVFHPATERREAQVEGKCPYCGIRTFFAATLTGTLEHKCTCCKRDLLVVLRDLDCRIYRGIVENVVRSAEKSGLVDPVVLKGIVAQRDEWKTVRGFGDRLISEAGLTEWQAEKLLEEKHKGFFLGDYRIEACVADDMMYQAVHVVSGKRMRLLVAPRSSEWVQQRQAKAVELTHPNLLPSQYVHEPPIDYLVFDSGDALSLQEHVETKGLLPEPQAVEIVLALCDAVALLEKHDLKWMRLVPVHVFLFPNEAPRLLAVAREKPLGLRLDPPNDFEGPAAYALGCILSFALTGTPETWTHVPFPKLTMADDRFSHRIKKVTLEMMSFRKSFDRPIEEVAAQLRRAASRFL